MYDLLLKGGRVVDPSQDMDGTFDVAFAGGKVAAVEAGIDAARATDVRDVTGKIVSPGLIDLHTHVYWGGTSLGVDAETVARRSGTTTFVDAGSAGPGNLAGFRKHVIEPSAPRILAYLNISFAGIFGFSKTVMVGECENLRLLDARECLRVARENLDILVGMKARVGARAGGNSGMAPLSLAIEVADALGLPVMAHIDNPPPTREEVLAALRPGDILTHCFRPFPNAPIHGDRTIRQEILDARERGIIFDIGHGYGGFSFESGVVMLEEGIKPDVLSSDIHVLCVDGPAYDVLAVMSKFMALGMSLTEVIAATTVNPAKAVRRDDIGTLKVGSAGDATIIEEVGGRFTHTDAVGETVTTDRQLEHRGIVIGGAWWQDAVSA
ncbi:amidohydrolase/deacetylase family metallohydrolase [Tropicimonas sp. IMCC6043]|uniref:amidohydrolase/deacetylase family metallohydrolase n=1 Tax=Tropicimonas sp. IMCC6043 TaxID=2510645 RepID=UPI00101C7D5F|nr:amidohydrolase/deacetylase family metallohydrolase [Tropicimonas sp. IMCC6043]RYH07537.1 amidohydrolase/deacetylase family metallohydrolase [Tropicimonas sp. IMCC6043]